MGQLPGGLQRCFFADPANGLIFSG